MSLTPRIRPWYLGQNGGFVTADDDASEQVVLLSSNGSSWTSKTVTTPAGDFLVGVAFGNNHYVVIGDRQAF